jgi:hypothetical protein
MKSAVLRAVTRRLVVITTRRRVITQKTTDFNFKIIQKIPEQHTGKHGIKELQNTAILALHTYCGKY